MAKLLICDTQYYYECHGTGEPLVLIAGYACDHTFWDLMLDALTPHFKVVTFDNAGIGQTQQPTTPITLARMADDTMHLVKALDLPNPIILGQSMGGAIAQIIAQKYQHEISKLIILNSSAQISVRTLMMLQSLLNIYQEKIPFDTLIEASMPWFFSSHYLSSASNISHYKKLCLENPFPPTVDLLGSQLQALRQFNATAWLPELSTPTLVIASEDDIVCLPTESEDLAKRIAKAQFVQIAGGHSSPIENPKSVAQAILNFQAGFQNKPKVISIQ